MMPEIKAVAPYLCMCCCERPRMRKHEVYASVVVEIRVREALPVLLLARVGHEIRYHSGSIVVPLA
jgi:hypothetical protein